MEWHILGYINWHMLDPVSDPICRWRNAIWELECASKSISQFQSVHLTESSTVKDSMKGSRACLSSTSLKDLRSHHSWICMTDRNVTSTYLPRRICSTTLIRIPPLNLLLSSTWASHSLYNGRILDAFLWFLLPIMSRRVRLSRQEGSPCGP